MPPKRYRPYSISFGLRINSCIGVTQTRRVSSRPPVNVGSIAAVIVWYIRAWLKTYELMWSLTLHLIQTCKPKSNKFQSLRHLFPSMLLWPPCTKRPAPMIPLAWCALGSGISTTAYLRRDIHESGSRRAWLATRTRAAILSFIIVYSFACYSREPIIIRLSFIEFASFIFYVFISEISASRLALPPSNLQYLPV